ncbi:MAG: serine/threonine-protein kinase [Planctomycetota bacterium]
MGFSRRRQAEALFHQVADLPAERRTAFLDSQPDLDPEVRREVMQLLNRIENVHMESLRNIDFMEREVEDSLEGQQIGPYKLLQRIGEGGFGAVYMAEQSEPIRRKVALKVIKPGMDSRQVIARFEAERQALAMMDHPNIARVFDAGETDNGHPYFVMELVRGVPITEYCDANRLVAGKRIELFIQVCRAVQHAHQKGIIHRDLKPTNIMVTLHDGTPVPKVIDFGIARATDQSLTDKTVFTRFGQLMGTPQYMSPEQAVISGLDVDTRSDIYSLGVLLYELLTGTTPFTPETFQNVGFTEIQRLISEQTPPRPSLRVSTLSREMSSIARVRCMEPAALSRFIRGELDWIVMKALEKDRERRYDTAQAWLKMRSGSSTASLCWRIRRAASTSSGSSWRATRPLPDS